jgi:MOSC domain-containing protein YiiM
MDHIYQINISKGGVPKLPVKSVYVSKKGLVGDKHKNKKEHGGPDRAVCLFSIDVIEKLQQEGHPIFAGTAGENITLRYQEYFALHEGTQLKLGEDVLIEITSYTAPCKTIRTSFLEDNFNVISQKLYPGYSRLYAKVLKEGWIAKGDLIQKIK